MIVAVPVQLEDADDLVVVHYSFFERVQSGRVLGRTCAHFSCLIQIAERCRFVIVVSDSREHGLELVAVYNRERIARAPADRAGRGR